MQVLEAIRTRRSIGKTTDQVPTREQINLLLEAATWAPNHHLTIPWRFVVVAGDVRAEFGRITSASKLRRMQAEGRDITGEEEALIRKAFRAPVIIAVCIEPAENVPESDEIAAGAAATQNVLLAAHALGLAAIWRTGDGSRDPDVVRWLGLSERAKVVGFVYVGYPAVTKERSKHIPFDQLTEWRGWGDDPGNGH